MRRSLGVRNRDQRSLDRCGGVLVGHRRCRCRCTRVGLVGVPRRGLPRRRILFLAQFLTISYCERTARAGPKRGFVASQATETLFSLFSLGSPISSRRSADTFTTGGVFASRSRNNRLRQQPFPSVSGLVPPKSE